MNKKPELFLLSGEETLNPEVLAKLFSQLTGKPTTAEAMKAAMDGAEARAADYKKNFRPAK